MDPIYYNYLIIIIMSRFHLIYILCTWDLITHLLFRQIY